MGHFITTHKVIWIVVAYSLLLVGLLLVVTARDLLRLISPDGYQNLWMAMVFMFPFVIIALMWSVSSDDYGGPAGLPRPDEAEW